MRHMRYIIIQCGREARSKRATLALLRRGRKGRRKSFMEFAPSAADRSPRVRTLGPRGLASFFSSFRPFFFRSRKRKRERERKGDDRSLFSYSSGGGGGIRGVTKEISSQAAGSTADTFAFARNAFARRVAILERSTIIVGVHRATSSFLHGDHAERNVRSRLLPRSRFLTIGDRGYSPF